MIAIIDYGMGNLRSVYNAFQAVDARPQIVNQPAQLRDARAVVLPGVGAFGNGMRNLRERGFLEALEVEICEKGMPFLGLCLGLQLLATKGFEHGENVGMNWISGTVEKITPPNGAGLLRVPHIGWNDVRIAGGSNLYQGLGEVQSFYFVHSYVLRPDDASVVTGRCDYGGEFAASIESGNISATQFHPEKSHRSGLAVLRNWVGCLSHA